MANPPMLALMNASHVFHTTRTSYSVCAYVSVSFSPKVFAGGHLPRVMAHTTLPAAAMRWSEH
jgi:hypothetical protein